MKRSECLNRTLGAFCINTKAQINLAFVVCNFGFAELTYV